MGLFSDDVNGGTIVSAKFTRVRPHWSRRCGFHLRGRIFLWKNFSERVISVSRLSRNHFAGGTLSVQAHGCEAHLGSLLNRQKLVPIFLVQQVPEPTVHAVLRVGTHLANLKRVRSIVFEELRNPDELERKRFVLAHKGGISENQFHCRPQAWRIGKFRVNLVELPFVDRIGISNWHRYLTMLKLLIAQRNR
jgi:hypothetical protein